MAALLASAVTVNDTWKEGGTSGRKFLVKDVTISAPGNGSVANPIPSSVFGMTRISGVRAARVVAGSGLTAGQLINAWPSVDGTVLYLSAPENAAAQTPADFTATIRLTVQGTDGT